MGEGKLPEGWILCQVGDVCELNPKDKLDDELEVGFMPMAGLPVDYLRKCKFERKTWINVKKGFTQFKNGDTIFAKITPCFENGKASVIDGFPNGYGAGSTEYFVLRATKELVDAKWLFSLVKTKEFLASGALNMSGSVGHKRVPKDFVLNYRLPLPSFCEQKIITDKLHTLLAQVDNIKARLDQIPQILKRFRQSVLSAAVSGRLTEGWRINNKLNKVVVKYNVNLPKLTQEEYYFDPVEGWQWIRLGSVVNLINGDRGKNYPNKSEYVKHGIPFINTGHINTDGTLADDRMNFISEAKYDSLSGGKTQSTDLVYCLRGATMGKTSRVHYKIGAIASSLVIVRPSDYIDRDFAYYFLISPPAKNLINEFDNGSAQPNLSAKSLATYPLQLPSFKEQTEIVRRVEQLFAYADKIEQQVQEALTRVNNLTQSILSKAFRGELTEQWRKDNPDLISGENSAEALLAKIKAERLKV